MTKRLLLISFAIAVVLTIRSELMMSPVFAQEDGAAATVLITGSNRGIGLEFVRQYAEQGWNVIATARKPDSADELKALADQHSNITIEKLDVTDLEGIDALAEQYKDTPIDVLINNAGILGDVDKQKVGSFDYDEFQQVMAVNVFGPIKVTDAFLPHVEKSNQKKVIVLASGLGSITLTQRRGNFYFYRISKASANMLMRTFAADTKEKGILIGIMGPGMVDTRLLAASGYRGPSLSTEDSVNGLIAMIENLTPENSATFQNVDSDDEVPW